MYHLMGSLWALKVASFAGQNTTVVWQYRSSFISHKQGAIKRERCSQLDKASGALVSQLQFLKLNNEVHCQTPRPLFVSLGVDWLQNLLISPLKPRQTEFPK